MIAFAIVIAALILAAAIIYRSKTMYDPAYTGIDTDLTNLVAGITALKAKADSVDALQAQLDAANAKVTAQTADTFDTVTKLNSGVDAVYAAAGLPQPVPAA